MVKIETLAFVVCFFLSTVAGAVQNASSAEQYAGTWSGTWDGAGSGDFELTLEKKGDGVAGKVAVTTDGGPYNAELKGIVFDGAKMTAAYDFPLDPNAEVGIAATFDGRAAKGTWRLHPKGQDADVASGTFTVAKK